MEDKWYSIFCHKCKKEILKTRYRDAWMAYNPVAGDIIEIKGHWFGHDINVPIHPSDGKTLGYKYNIYLHSGCYKGPRPDIFPEVVELFDNPYKK